MALTDPEFWDSYWGDTSLPSLVDLTDPGSRALAEAVAARLQPTLQAASEPARRSTTGERERAGSESDPSGESTGHLGARPKLVELGCAPGRWLAYFYNLGFDVSGVENSPHGATLTRKNLELLDVEADVVEADVLDLFDSHPELADSFDAVVSLGLVEHFDDPAKVFEVHAALARPGGSVLIGVPNLSGIIGAIQRKLDPEWMARHHVATIAPDRLRGLGEEAGLECVDVSYAAGFQPHLFQWTGRSLLGLVATRAGTLYTKLPWQRDSRWVSGTIMAVYEKSAH